MFFTKLCMFAAYCLRVSTLSSTSCARIAGNALTASFPSATLPVPSHVTATLLSTTLLTSVKPGRLSVASAIFHDGAWVSTQSKMLESARSVLSDCFSLLRPFTRGEAPLCRPGISLQHIDVGAVGPRLVGDFQWPIMPPLYSKLHLFESGSHVGKPYQVQDSDNVLTLSRPPSTPYPWYSLLVVTPAMGASLAAEPTPVFAVETTVFPLPSITEIMSEANTFRVTEDQPPAAGQSFKVPYRLCLFEYSNRLGLYFSQQISSVPQWLKHRSDELLWFFLSPSTLSDCVDAYNDQILVRQRELGAYGLSVVMVNSKGKAISRTSTTVFSLGLETVSEFAFTTSGSSGKVLDKRTYSYGDLMNSRYARSFLTPGLSYLQGAVSNSSSGTDQGPILWKQLGSDLRHNIPVVARKGKIQSP